MSIKFREEPKGAVDIKNAGVQATRGKRPLGLVCKDLSKAVFSAEPVRKLAGRGCWFEVRVDTFAGGEMNLMAIGFTATDPATFLAADEGSEATPLPGFAGTIPRSYVAGYTDSLYWEEERLQIESIFKKVKPAKPFTLAALATMNGGLEIYVNRRLVCSFDPSATGHTSIEIDQPLWAVLDLSGGCKKANLLDDSVPPTPEEAAAPEEEDGDGKKAAEEGEDVGGEGEEAAPEG
eukprot:CAMPEP_0197657912 /NCGR_PEP_ID=MMETSP1338-20131121/44921_1 /TAXON_ID=43686 ORGANISM="Pelagodinium beii, Strain RCC1491" /NCGR_SAMPLE_ID=MMETSP1338 /ASSEMBLY_ACC=CAM_ASM_000754 /LENGTH=234 /DNA_ID=CAMNT_0043234389 /DNA_START=73 /DNA_END=777 /DNA_ORIENTATION=+